MLHLHAPLTQAARCRYDDAKAFRRIRIGVWSKHSTLIIEQDVSASPHNKLFVEGTTPEDSTAVIRLPNTPFLIKGQLTAYKK